jgi:small subunit ribosomal protein S9
MALYVHGTGRRKTSVARVHLKQGAGSFVINKREANEYLNNELLKLKVNQPFVLLGINSGEFDILVNVAGGGVNGQAEAIRLGISRALMQYNPEYRPVLKKAGLVRVDSRIVERKKPGRRKARKRFQFSKR